jgi:hypothetical protein
MPHYHFKKSEFFTQSWDDTKYYPIINKIHISANGYIYFSKDGEGIRVW